MTRAFASSVIDADADAVWAHIRDFNALPAWHPLIRESRIEDGLPSAAVGCVRAFFLQDGGFLREKLLALSDEDRACTYSILQSPMPLTDYVARLEVMPVTDGDGAYIAWTADFRCAPEEAAGLAEGIGQGVFQKGMDALKGAVRRGSGRRLAPDFGRPTVLVSKVIDAPVAAAWAILRDFNGLPDFHPAFADSRIEDGRRAEEIGAVRNFNTHGRVNIREQLLALSDEDHIQTYCILTADDLPMRRYVASCRLYPITDGDRTFATWRADYDCDLARAEEARALVAGTFQAAFDAVAARVGR